MKKRRAVDLLSVAAAEMGRRGGFARAKKLSKAKRVEISSNAAKKRWEHHKKASAA